MLNNKQNQIKKCKESMLKCAIINHDYRPECASLIDLTLSVNWRQETQLCLATGEY